MQSKGAEAPPPDSGAEKMVAEARELTGVNTSNTIIYVLGALAAMIVFGALSFAVLTCSRARRKRLKESEELEM